MAAGDIHPQGIIGSVYEFLAGKYAQIVHLVTPNGDSVYDDTNDALKVVIATALSNLIDQISAHDTTNSIMSGTTALTPKFAVIDAASSGDNTIVAAVTAKKIRVLSLFLVSAGTVTTRFEAGAGGTALTGQMSLVANTGFALPYNPKGWFETTSAALLNLELSAAVSVDGALSYIEV